MLEEKSMFDKSKVDLDFAEKLRKESPNQFKTLINMHLSFLLEIETLNDNEPDANDKVKAKKNWLFSNKKKPTSICTSHSNVKSPDCPILTDDLIKKLIFLMKFLEKDENLKQEGIFRKTGSVSRQQELKFLVNQSKTINLDEFTCHDVASVMKSILADLPEPLLTETYFPAYSQLADVCNSKENDEDMRIKNAIQLLCLLLPIENRIVLENLICLLHKASEMEAYNKMTSDTLSTLFTPHLICPKRLSPEVLHQTAATMTKMISFMITKGITIFLVPEKLSTDIRAYFVEQKRRRETPERALDESVSDSVANTVFTFVDREKTAEAHNSNSTDTALAQLYAHIHSLPESTKKKKLIKQFNKQNGQGTPLQYVNREKPASSSACRSITDSIKKHIFHKSLHKQTPKFGESHVQTPVSSNVARTPLNAQIQPNKRILFQSPISETITSTELKPPQVIVTPIQIHLTNASNDDEEVISPIKNKIDDAQQAIPEPSLKETSQEDMIDDEDFQSSDEEGDEEDPVPVNMEMEHKSIIPLEGSPPLAKKSFTTRLMKGVSLGNLKFPFHSSTASPRTSPPPKLKKSKSSSILVDLEKEDEKRKILTRSATESFDSEESEMFFSLCDATKDNYTDVSNINYFLNQTGLQDHHPTMRHSVSPITKSTQRMPKSMQESIMTPRSRKPVMLAIFGNSDPKSSHNNISQLLEESEEMLNESNEKPRDLQMIAHGEIDDIASANDNGLPVFDTKTSNGSSSSSNSGSLSSAFRDYLQSRGNVVYEPPQDDESFSSQPDDFESSTEEVTEYQKLESSSSSSEKHEMDVILNQSSNINESLLFCLDGNNVSPPVNSCNRKRVLDEESRQDSSNESIKRPLLEVEPADSEDYTEL